MANLVEALFEAIVAEQSKSYVAMSTAKITTMKANDLFAPDLLAPPREWFEEYPEEWASELASNTLWVNDEGRIAGEITGDSYILNGRTEKWKPPQLASANDKYLYQGATVFKDGTTMPTTDLAFTEGHMVFPDWQLSHAFNAGQVNKQGVAIDDPERISNKVARVRYIPRPNGRIGVVGALYHTVTAGKVAIMRGSAISGHWQPVPPEAGVQFLGAVFVNKPGLPLAKVACFSPTGEETYAIVAAMPETLDQQPTQDAQPQAQEQQTPDLTPPPQQDSQAQEENLQLKNRVAELEGKLDSATGRLDQVEGILTRREMEELSLSDLDDSEDGEYK